LEEAVGYTLNTLPDVFLAGKELQNKYGCSLVVTLGDEGALVILPDKAYHVPVVKVDVVSTAGAGDGVLAGIAAGLSKGWPAEEGIRLGIAMAGAVCMQLATADCRKEDIDRLIPQVQFIPFEM
jgi:fructose-1-phosphate kinase PfkB-like protein